MLIEGIKWSFIGSDWGAYHREARDGQHDRVCGPEG